MKLCEIIATFFYIGKLPIAPGTYASLLTAILYFIINPLPFIQLIVIVILLILGIISSNKISIKLQKHDPSEIVIDEVTGMAISLLMLPHDIYIYIIAFILFRIFDIFKPSFIYRVQNLYGGVGIMADDILSGLFTLIMCHCIYSIL